MSLLPKHMELFECIAGMTIDSLRVIPLQGATYDSNGNHKMQVAAYNYAYNMGYRVRTIVHDDRLFVIRVA